MSRNPDRFLFSPLMEREKVQLSNRDVSALVMDVPLQLESPWDCAMNVHHQLWLRSNDQEVRVAQRWMKWWGWMPRFWGDRRFAQFMSSWRKGVRRRRRGSFSVTMIPGPKSSTSLNGNPITSIVTAEAPVGNEEMHVSVMCYNNKVGKRRVMSCRFRYPSLPTVPS